MRVLAHSGLALCVAALAAPIVAGAAPKQKQPKPVQTVNPPDLTGRPRAWVRPALVRSTPNSAVDASGFQGQANDFSCVGWSFALAANSGLTVSADGSFFAEASTERGRCDVSRPAACCAPLP
jgi:hypothetical protein